MRNIIIPDGQIIACSGTTLDNFLTCAGISGNMVQFDKLREPRHDEDIFYYLPGSIGRGVMDFAFKLARKLGSQPLIMEGYVPNALGGDPLHEGELFPVLSVYMIKGGLDWRAINIFEDGTRSYFEVKDALEFLRECKSHR